MGESSHMTKADAGEKGAAKPEIDEGIEFPALAPPVPARAPLVTDLGPIPSLRITAPDAGSTPSLTDVGVSFEEDVAADAGSGVVVRSPSFTDLGIESQSIGNRPQSENSDARSEAGQSEASSTRSTSRNGDGRNRFERRLSRLQQEIVTEAGSETPAEKTLRLLTDAVQAAIGRTPDIRSVGPNKYWIEGKEAQVRLMTNGQVRIRNGGAWDPVDKIFLARPAAELGVVTRLAVTRTSLRPPSNPRIATAPRRGSAPPPRAGLRR